MSAPRVVAALQRAAIPIGQVGRGLVGGLQEVEQRASGDSRRRTASYGRMNSRRSAL